MNNYDRFYAELEKNPLAASKLACRFGMMKGSRAGAWDWADNAIMAAKRAGIDLDPGRQSWPNFESMLEQLGD